MALEISDIHNVFNETLPYIIFKYRLKHGIAPFFLLISWYQFKIQNYRLKNFIIIKNVTSVNLNNNKILIFGDPWESKMCQQEIIKVLFLDF